MWNYFRVSKTGRLSSGKCWSTILALFHIRWKIDDKKPPKFQRTWKRHIQYLSIYTDASNAAAIDGSPEQQVKHHHHFRKFHSTCSLLVICLQERGLAGGSQRPELSWQTSHHLLVARGECDRKEDLLRGVTSYFSVTLQFQTGLTLLRRHSSLFNFSLFCNNPDKYYIYLFLHNEMF